ncbi:Spectrin repeat superfamily Extracellular matrix-binding protein, putative [Babesia ovata]|uniref:Spectrin repeat superfamily Extracellular matrix-binding protein, putative n=1 Tax=Babesia ovata TaxID=189622 RepID=A0A2H6KKE6_9APIC|nr:Spectrin repeat superfamily Extracellular matrix-binding protein, putative [Babesia ovata]GBE63459.1 Spectrin repeat superfamily Extracellular matrix-binding protein, putative [Babesia ovata]
MSFLHGVLNEVHRNDNLSPYKKALNETVTLLESKRYEGKTGLQSVIDHVKQGIGQWLVDVEKKNGYVTGPINNLDVDVGVFLKYFSALKDNNDFEEQKSNLKSSIKSLKQLSFTASSIPSALDYIDKNLQKELSPHVSLIKDRVDTFVDSTKQDHAGLKKVCERVDEKMSIIIEHSESVSGNAANKIDSLTTFLKGEINTLHEHIKKVVPGVKKAIEELEKWLKNDNGSNLHNALQKCDAVVKALDENESTFKTHIENIEQTRQTVSQVHSQLGGIDTSLQQWIQKSGSTIQSVLDKVNAIISAVHESKTSIITQAVESLKRQTQNIFLDSKKQQLKVIGHQAKEKLTGLATAVDSLINERLRDEQREYSQLTSSLSSTALNGSQLHQWSQAALIVLDVGKNVDDAIKHIWNRYAQFVQSPQLSLPLEKWQQSQQQLPGLKFFAQRHQKSSEIAEVTSHHQTLNSYASATRAFMTAFVESIKGGVQLEVHSATTNLHNISDLKQLTESLSGALQLAQQLHNNLQQFTRHSSFSSIRDANRELSSLVHEVSNFHTTFDRETKAVEKLEESFTTNFDRLVSDVKTAAGESQPTGMKKTLTDLRENKIHSKEEGQLGKIKNDIHSQMSQLFPKISAISSAVEQIKAQLIKVSEMVKKGSEKETINGFLESLKGEISSLKQSLTDLKAGDLTSMIANVQHEFDEAKKFIVKYIQSTCNEAISNAKVAGKEIKQSALSQFAQAKAHALEQLKALVEEQNEIIQNKIHIDTETGLKGFMKLFNTNFIPKIEEIGGIKPNSFTPEKSPLNQAAEKVCVGFEMFFKNLEKQRKEFEDFPPGVIQPDAMLPEVSKYESVTNALLKLLEGLHTSKHFDHNFSDHLKSLNNALSTFSPAKFTDSSSPILQALKDGIGALAQQLGYAYVSTYCCKKFDGALLDPQDPPKTSDDKRKLTEYGMMLSKVFMTCLPGWGKHLDWLRRHCDQQPKKGPWNGLQITKLKNNPLGLWPGQSGRELRNTEKCIGNHIHGFLVDNRKDQKRLYRNDDEKQDPGTLREVRHHEHFDSPKPPTTVSHMLQWITGLTYNPMLEKLDSHFTTMFQGLKKAYKLDNPHIAITKPFRLNLGANEDIVGSGHLNAVLRRVCETAETVLISLQGHGHAAGRYACEYSSNVDKLDYTTSPSRCFDLLCEICLKLHDQLNFLYRHCSHPSKLGGWQDCWYGNGVAGTSWQCNNLQCPDQPYNQEGNQTHRQSCNQSCNQSADCGLKSPLQSYLEDGLPGFLPHHLKKLGCGVECSLGKHRGLPCLTPMGFSEIGTVASHRQKGEDLKKVLEKFCGQPSKPLTLFCSYVKCLLHIPPQTLGDMFAFYYGFLNGWNGSGIHRKGAFEQAVQNADFENTNTTLNVGTMFQSSDHTGTSTTHAKGDLCSLVTCDGGIATLDPVGTCGPYLRPLCMDNRGIYSSTFKNYYLSWIVYATETFSRLLKDLLEECRQSCGLPKSKCHTTSCVTNCRTVVSDITSPNRNHQQGCKSIVKCKSTLPNLYKYGFYFGNTDNLSGTEDIRTKRTCNDFCDALDRVLSEVKDKNDVLAKLIYKTIPKFLWDIRSKFSYLLLALWSLSLLYLLHIAVVRLDVLRIRSHLRSPSSHRIAAQSLLAAARVKALANVKYFSP